MTVALDVYDDFLKEWYLSEWIDQLTSMTTTWKLLRRKLTNFAGKFMVIPIRTGRNAGVGAIPTSSSGALSALYPHGNQSVGRTLVDGKIFSGGLQVAQDTIDKSKNDQGAFFEAIDFEMRGLVDDVADYADNVMHQAGDSALAQTTGVGVANVVPVTTHHPFFEGMVVEFWSGNTGADTVRQQGSTNAAARFVAIAANTQSAQRITAVVRNIDGSGTITVGDDVAIASGDYIARVGTRTAALSHELMGLNGAISASNPPLDASFQGIDRATAGYWQSYEDSSGANEPNEDDIQQALDHTHDTSRGDVDVLMCNRILRRLLYASLAGSNHTRFVDTNVISPGYLSGKKEDHHPDGADYLFFDGRLPIIVDRFSRIDVPARPAAISSPISSFGGASRAAAVSCWNPRRPRSWPG